MKAWVARAAVDSKEVKVRVKAGKDGVFVAVLGQIRCCWGEEVRSSTWLDRNFLDVEGCSNSPVCA